MPFPLLVIPSSHFADFIHLIFKWQHLLSKPLYTISTIVTCVRIQFIMMI